MPKRRTLTTEPEYLGHPINTGANNDLPCVTRILDTNLRVLDRFTENHHTTLMSRIDFRYPQGFKPDGNEDMKNILAQGIKSLQRQYGTKLGYVMVLEESDDGGVHFNGFTLQDMSVLKSPLPVVQTLERIADRITGVAGQNGTDNQGLVQLCQNGVVIHRGNQEEYDEAFYRVSYLAKLKDKTESGREIFCSKTR